MNFRFILLLFLFICIVISVQSDVSPESRIFAGSIGFFNVFLKLFRVLYTFGKEFKTEMQYNSISHLGYEHLQSATNNEAAEVVRCKRRKKLKKKLIIFPEECSFNKTSNDSMIHNITDKIDLNYESMNFTIDDYLLEMNNTMGPIQVDNSTPFYQLNNENISNTTLNTTYISEYMNFNSTRHKYGDNYMLDFMYIESKNDTFQEDKVMNCSSILQNSNNMSSYQETSTTRNQNFRRNE
ncbi:hypothetical protein FG386_000761 [Cryptosporidium ryanae]|uniref:uncharacterized protein n=1 Tax=Cryptosporidium ryanae TaxID=515981 RepID=UPI00351A9B29|nr:hypothetical protein FG386_000761 [Cryptosporidium ryanae]